jgi:uncharacterized protein
VGGLVGSGKTTLAEALGRALRVPIISSDATRKSLAGMAPTERGTAALYTSAQTRRTYHELGRRALAVVSSGRGVVLDATFGDAQDRTAVRALAAEHGRRFRFVEVACEEAVARARLAARAASASPNDSDAGPELLAAVQARWQPPRELPPGERVLVDGAGDVDDGVEVVRAALA